jgi:hypothetical protein
MTGFILTAFGLPPALSQEKPGNPAYDWLNGKWFGPAPGGGELELKLRVLNGDEITGESRIPRPGSKRDITKNVSGSVDGDKVHLELYRGEKTQRWTFSHKEGILWATRKGEEMIFKKLE